MTHRKIQVGILFGGKSAEHEVSLQSAKNVADAIDRDKYQLSMIGIDKSGRWRLHDQTDYLRNAADPKRIALDDSGAKPVALVPQGGGELIDLSCGEACATLDVVFPILHGPFGEDGTVQGLLTLAGVPFVGAGVLGSAVGMDKDVAKRLLRDAGLPVARFAALRAGDAADFKALSADLGLPLFVKPANMGSSVGVRKAAGAADFADALAEAFCYDTKVVVEEFVAGRELECSVLGNRTPAASVLGEIVPHHDFYSYEAKYIDDDGAGLVVPADVAEDTAARLRALAVRAFEVLGCEGMARVDFFLKTDGSVVINEINTIPGFTRISMYPRLWAASGVSYPDLIDRLIDLAIERFGRQQTLRNSC